jgi:hypothetical protein
MVLLVIVLPDGADIAAAAAAVAAAANVVVLRDVRLEKRLNLQRTAQHLLLTNQWAALESNMIALAR